MEKQQEVLAGIADVIMETFAMESVAAPRSRRTESEVGADMCAVLLPRCHGAHRDGFARPVLAACAEGDALRANMAVLRRFAKFEPVNSIALRQTHRRAAARAPAITLSERPRIVLAVGLPGSGKIDLSSRNWGESDFERCAPAATRRRRDGPDHSQPGLRGHALSAAPAPRTVATGHLYRCDEPDPPRPPAFLKMARKHDCTIEAIWFDVPLTICKARNAARGRVVPEHAMDLMAAKFVPPSLDEGFDRVNCIEI